MRALDRTELSPAHATQAPMSFYLGQRLQCDLLSDLGPAESTHGFCSKGLPATGEATAAEVRTDPSLLCNACPFLCATR